MLKLTANRNYDQHLKLVADLRAAGETAASVNQVVSFFEDLWKAPLGDLTGGNATVRFTGMTNERDLDEEYEKVEFLVTGRFVQGDTRWLVGGGFAVDLDSVLERIRAASADLDR